MSPTTTTPTPHYQRPINFFHLSISDLPPGMGVCQLYIDLVPQTAENFRQYFSLSPHIPSLHGAPQPMSCPALLFSSHPTARRLTLAPTQTAHNSSSHVPLRLTSMGSTSSLARSFAANLSVRHFPLSSSPRSLPPTHLLYLFSQFVELRTIQQALAMYPPIPS